VNRKTTPRARLSLASLTLTVLASCAALPASAVQTHTLKSGETLGSLARRYNVNVKELMAWNGIKHPEKLRDGTKLLIPANKTSAKITAAPAPRSASKSAVVAPRTGAALSASVKGSSVSVRIAPGTEARRVTLLASGTPLTVTAQAKGWAQVQLPGGGSGWVMTSYLRIGGQKKTAPIRLAAKPATGLKAAKHTAKWTPAKPAASKTVAKNNAAWQKKAAKIARDNAAKKAQAQAIAEARKANARRRYLAKLTRNAPRVATRYIPEANAPHAGSDLVRSAYSYRGTPYRYGGSARGGFDCSGFTSYLYRQKGISLPHSARAQAKMGQKVDKGNLKAGDLVFFHTVTPGISHVGMYVGDGKFVHASSRRSGGVRIDSLNSGYYSQRFRGARRYSK
jgi:cell wall-associated NlpC family hydrolase/LysM repeat protein